MTESVTSTMLWPWAIPVIMASALLAVIVVAVLSWRRRKSASQRNAGRDSEIWVANSAYVRSLPEFSRLRRRYRMLQCAGVVFLAIALSSTAFLAAQPATVKTTNPKMANRDIVLCLDVSASMLAYDRELVNVFSTLVDNFAGERIALSIFNTTSRTVFPLTDDYAMVKEQLSEAYDALHPNAVNGNSSALARYEYFVAGANANINAGSSLIGDGLANCALLFESSQHPILRDDPATNDTAGNTAEVKEAQKALDDAAGDKINREARSRSIIFATDNDLEGDPIYSLSEAAKLAKKLGVSLIGMYGSGSTDLEGEEEFHSVFEEHGGLYFYSDDPTMVDSIVTDIQSRQAVQHDAAPLITRTNTTGPWLGLLFVGLLGFAIVQWRLGE